MPTCPSQITAAELMIPKPIRADPNQTGTKKKEIIPSRIRAEFHTNLIFFLGTVMEKSQCANGGMRAIAMMTDATNANVLVYARGLNNFPSEATIVNTGRKLTIVVVMAVKTAGATSTVAL